MPDPEDLSFDTATAIRETADPDVFVVSIHPHWTVGDKANGGYILALLGRAHGGVGVGAAGPGAGHCCQDRQRRHPPKRSAPPHQKIE